MYACAFAYTRAPHTHTDLSHFPLLFFIYMFSIFSFIPEALEMMILLWITTYHLGKKDGQGEQEFLNFKTQLVSLHQANQTLKSS